MRILIAPNAFKGSLSVVEAARAMARGVRDALPDARTILAPISDGGDGLIEALTADLGGQRVHVKVRGPLGEPRQAAYGWLPGRIAVIEIARASGLALVPPGRRDVMRATSFGTGQLIDAALRRGARKILVGLGGSASNDGGAGMAQALGCALLDKEGRELPAGAGALRRLAKIDAGSLKKRLRAVTIVGLSDVTNPLLGPDGSAPVYGPQKGATPDQVPLLEEGLERLAAVVKRDLGIDVAVVPGAGAAGGLGAGLLAFLRARLAAGAPYVLRQIKIKKLLDGADAVITGEGFMDRTSFLGKAPLELAVLAKSKGVPVACVCGDYDPVVAGRLKEAGIEAVVSFKDTGAGPRTSFSKASQWAERAAGLAVKKLGLSAAAAACVLALARPVGAKPVAADVAKIDALYFQRDKDDNLAKSQALVDEALAKEPDRADLLWRQGRGLVRQGEPFKSKKDRLKRFEAAEKALKKSVQLQPKEPEAHFWLGVAMGRIGENRGVLKSLSLVGPIRSEMRTTISLDPKHGGAHRVLAEVLWQLPGFAGGDKKKALSEFEKAVNLSPSYTENYVPLAEAYERFKRKDDAIAVLQRGLAIKAPADPASWADDQKDMRELLGKLKR